MAQRPATASLSSLRDALLGGETWDGMAMDGERRSVESMANSDGMIIYYNIYIYMYILVGGLEHDL